MDAAEAAVYQIGSVDDALQLVIQVESSEVNQVFYAALAATDSAFVKKLKPFQEAMEAHMTYIVERIPQLSPHLMLACRELRAQVPEGEAVGFDCLSNDLRGPPPIPCPLLSFSVFSI